MALPASKRSLTILHTNDFHNRLTPGGAERIEQLLACTSNPKLLLDAGDAGGSTNITYRLGGEPILEEMSRLGYEAMTVGNRDFHVSRQGFRAKLARARFPVLCANIRPARLKDQTRTTGAEPPLANSLADDEPDLQSYLVRDLVDWRVLIVGLTVPMVTERMWERKLSAYIFEAPIRAAARIFPELHRRLQPDLTIALTHIGLNQDRALAETVSGIDLIIGGHSHELLNHGEIVGDTFIAQAGSHGRHIGVIYVEPPASGSRRCLIKGRIEAL